MQESSRFIAPREIHLERGSLGHLRSFRGERAAILCGKSSFVNSGELARAQGLLQSARIKSRVFPGIVSNLDVAPLLLPFLFNFGITLLLGPHALRNIERTKSEWRNHRRSIVAIAAMYPLAYILVLTAMVFTPLSYVAPAREISILFGALAGSRFLGEVYTVRRMVAAG